MSTFVGSSKEGKKSSPFRIHERIYQSNTDSFVLPQQISFVISSCKWCNVSLEADRAGVVRGKDHTSVCVLGQSSRLLPYHPEAMLKARDLWILLTNDMEIQKDNITKRPQRYPLLYTSEWLSYHVYSRDVPLRSSSGSGDRPRRGDGCVYTTCGILFCASATASAGYS